MTNSLSDLPRSMIYGVYGGAIFTGIFAAPVLASLQAIYHGLPAKTKTVFLGYNLTAWQMRYVMGVTIFILFLFAVWGMIKAFRLFTNLTYEWLIPSGIFLWYLLSVVVSSGIYTVRFAVMQAIFVGLAITVSYTFLINPPGLQKAKQS